MCAPFEVSEILVHARSTERPPGRTRKIWKNDRSVANHGNHRMRPIYFALADVSPRMGMHVCDDVEIRLSAVFPQCGLPTCMEGSSSPR